MYRRLLLYAGDLRQTPWYGHADSPPVHPEPAGVRLRWLDSTELENDPCVIDRPAAVRRRRLEDAGRCLAGFETATGATVYHLWVTTVGAYVDWIFRYLEAPPGGILVHDVWVHPRWRGGAIHKVGAALAAREALRLGRPEVWAGVEEHEFFPFAAMYARAGIAVIDARYFLVGLKLGPLSLHWRRPPPARALAFSARLRQHGLREPHDEPGQAPLPV